ncbi:hypothetical protein HY407_00650 [Candidatus Gottesmanbacteria bacterium]|nr:hypothetical protein [Candidatus Gottesmanbacteria bacterium]
MTNISAQLNTKSIYQSSLFSLTISQSSLTTLITMRLHTSVVNTQYIPDTYSLLEKFIPSVLGSKCFNDHKFAFREESQKTEIGHLFEHILLEYLCLLKLSYGVTDPIYNGLTTWDWQKDKRGTFHISLDIGRNELDLFIQALKKSILLLNRILYTKTVNKSPNFLHSN